MVAFAILVSATMFANESAPFAGQYIDGKLYVEPGTVHVAPNGIFLAEGGNFIPVKGVCIDECGIYVLGYDLVRSVKCPKCKNYYDADNQSSTRNNGVHGWKCQYPS